MRRPLLGAASLVLALVAATTVPAADAAADAARDRVAAWHRARAVRLEIEGRQNECVEEWIALTKIAPHDRDAAVRAAVAIVELVAAPPNRPRPDDPQYRAARELIAEAIARGATHDPALAYAIGRLELASGSFLRAEQMLGFARRRGFDPARARLWNYRAVVSDTGRLIETYQEALVVQRLQRAIADYPGHPDELAAQINLATAHRRLDEQSVAEQILKDVIAKHPWAARAHLALGQVYGDQSRFDEAMAALREAMDRSREREDGVYSGQAVLVESMLWAAGTELRRGNLDAAETLTRQYEALQKDSPDAMFLLGTIALRRGGKDDVAAALPLLRRAVRLVPDRREFVARLIEALHTAGEEAEVVATTKRLAEIEADRARKAGQFTPVR